MSESVVLLHGFGGTHRTWDAVAALLPPERYRALALDLPGHGAAADVPRPITFAGCVEHVLERSPARFVLGGYSMGARIALHVALAAPERVSRLVLVSATAGIEEEAQRAARRAADHELAAQLETLPYEHFVERWRARPLFAADPPNVVESARADQLRNAPGPLAAALRGIGTGEMTPLWERLGELQMPVTLLVGARDVKFTELGQRMATLISAARLTVLAGGHVLQLENPQGVVGALLEEQ